MATARDITVCTLTMPDGSRAEMLERNKKSVREQTQPVYAHLIDDAPGDMGDLYNNLVDKVETEWVALLDDDNYWHGHHVNTIVQALHNADVVYTWDSSGSRPRHNVNDKPYEWIEWLGEDSNWLDTSCAYRVSKWKEIGGMAGADGTQLKDWDLCKRMVEAKARFVCVPQATWRYSQFLWDGHVMRDTEGLFQKEL